MRHAARLLVCFLGASTFSLSGMVKIHLLEGRPTVNGVYINGQGPYRFLIDTGANTNLIAAGLAANIGVKATFRTRFASVSGEKAALGSQGNAITLDSAQAIGQEFLLIDTGSSRVFSGDVQGLLSQAFLARFDYRLDLERKWLSFGEQAPAGTRSAFQSINGRPAVSTSLGRLVLDSGAAAVVIGGAKIAPASGARAELRSAAGPQTVTLRSARLVLEGRTIWKGNAVALPQRLDPGVDGLLPIRFFRSVYVCNSGGYIVWER